MPNIDYNVVITNHQCEAIRNIETLLNNDYDFYDIEKAKLLMVLAGKLLNKQGAHRNEAHRLMSNAMEHPLALAP